MKDLSKNHKMYREIQTYLQNPSYWDEKFVEKLTERNRQIVQEFLTTPKTIATIAEEYETTKSNISIITRKAMLLIREVRKAQGEDVIKPKRETKIFSSDELVDLYQSLNQGQTLSQVARKYHRHVSSVSDARTRLFEAIDGKIVPKLNSYKLAIERITGQPVKNENAPLLPALDDEEYATPKREITTELLVKIWEMKKASTSDRGIAEQLGWVTKGSVKQVGIILDTLELYLSSNQYEEIRNKQKIYKEAREILLAKYPPERSGIYLYHDEDTDTLRACAGVDWDTQLLPEPEITPKETLDDSFKNLRKAIKAYIVDELTKQPTQKSLTEEIQEAIVPTITHVDPLGRPQSIAVTQSFPQEIDDNGVKGYFLSDIEAYLPTINVDRRQFYEWNQGKEGGIFQGKYYVLATNFKLFLDNLPK